MPITAKRREYNRLYHQKYSKLPKNRAYAENYQLVRYYGISVAIYHAMFEQQLGCCAICGRPQSELSKKMAVDHDHKTGKVRGLLCQLCNGMVLTVLEHYPHLIPIAQDYLSKQLNYRGKH